MLLGIIDSGVTYQISKKEKMVIVVAINGDSTIVFTGDTFKAQVLLEK